MQIMSKNRINNYVFLFMTVYMISYITRINYGAVITEIVNAEGILKSNASLALTASAITYGAGQIISGFLGDKYQPKFLISIGLFVTALMNLVLPFCESFVIISIVWGINGFAQAFMWPPIVRLMTFLFTPEVYSGACVKVSWGSSFGTIIVYLLAPIIISFSEWRFVFFISAGMAIIMNIIWLKTCPLISAENIDTSENKHMSNNKNFFTLLFVAIMVAIVLQGALRDGVTTWMPTYISETFNLSSSISILSGVLLPIFSILCFQVVHIVYKKMIKNELTLSGIIFGIGFLSALVLSIFAKNNAVLSVLLSTVLTGAMHGVNLMLICMLPEHFKRYGKVSLVSGILNSCTYVGSAISTYGLAVFSETFGWESTISLWAVIAFGGVIICLTLSKKWKKFKV